MAVRRWLRIVRETTRKKADWRWRFAARVTRVKSGRPEMGLRRRARAGVGMS